MYFYKEKKEVSRGGVRLRSRIKERPVEESIRLREENVRVERTPVDRMSSASNLANFKKTEIQMTETSEVPVVSKEARIVVEISLDKEVSQRTETISDTICKTEVDVEDLDKSSGSTNTTGFYISLLFNTVKAVVVKGGFFIACNLYSNYCNYSSIYGFKVY